MAVQHGMQCAESSTLRHGFLYTIGVIAHIKVPMWCGKPARVSRYCRGSGRMLRLRASRDFFFEIPMPPDEGCAVTEPIQSGKHILLRTCRS